MADDPVLEFKGGVGGVIGRAFVRFSVFVPAFGKMGSAKTGEGPDISEEILNDVLPVAKHVDDDAAVVFLAIVPGRALELFEFPWEYPVAELSADGEDFTEESGVDEVAQFEKSREPEFILDYAILKSCGSDFLGQGESFLGGSGGGLFAVDMLFGGDGFADSDRTLAGESGIKVNLVRGILKSGIEVGGDAGYAVGSAQGAELFLAATDEDGIGHNDFAWFDLDTALFTDGDDGADEVLIGAHAASDAVHDNADFMFFHIFISRYVDYGFRDCSRKGR